MRGGKMLACYDARITCGSLRATQLAHIIACDKLNIASEMALFQVRAIGMPSFQPRPQVALPCAYSMRVRMAKTFSMRRVSVGASLKRCVGQDVVRWGKHQVASAAKRGAHDVELSQIVAAPMQHVRRARARVRPF